jgi:hypothetical protein
MELFIPSMLVLVLGAFVSFYFIPKMSPYTIGFLSIALFAVGIWQNYTMFPYEYRMSMFTTVLKEYSPFIMILAVILGLMVAMSVVFGKNPPSIAEIVPEIKESIANILPAALTSNTNTKRNNTPAAGILPAVFNTGANTRVNNGTRANNTKANNGIASTSFKVV